MSAGKIENEIGTNVSSLGCIHLSRRAFRNVEEGCSECLESVVSAVAGYHRGKRIGSAHPTAFMTAFTAFMKAFVPHYIQTASAAPDILDCIHSRLPLDL